MTVKKYTDMKVIKVGRNPWNDFVFSNQTVSGDHAEIYQYDDGSMQIVDHSTNGTKVDSVHVHNSSRRLHGNEKLIFPGNNVLDVAQLFGTAPGPDSPEPPEPPEPDPYELKRWNWGAFYFGWLWGVCNGVYWPLITLIPYVGQIAALIIAFILGANGNRYAWENYKGSFADFKATQHSWTVAAGVCFAVTIVLIILAIIIIVASV